MKAKRYVSLGDLTKDDEGSILIPVTEQYRVGTAMDGFYSYDKSLFPSTYGIDDDPYNVTILSRDTILFILEVVLKHEELAPHVIVLDENGQKFASYLLKRSTSIITGNKTADKKRSERALYEIIKGKSPEKNENRSAT